MTEDKGNSEEGQHNNADFQVPATNREEKLIDVLQNIYLYIGPDIPKDCPEGLRCELKMLLEILRKAAHEYDFELPYETK